MIRRPIQLRPRALAVLAALVMVLVANEAFGQAAFRGGGSGTTARTAGTGTTTIGNAAGGMRQAPIGTPGGGTSALPPGAPSPSGLAPTTTFPAGLASPVPFPAGTPSTLIAAPGTSAAGTAPTGVNPTVVPSTASGVGAAANVGSTRGVVILPPTNTATVLPGATVNTTGAGTMLPGSTTADTATGLNAGTAGTVPFGASVNLGNAGLATGGFTGGGVAGAGGVTNGVPSVSPTTNVAGLGPLTPLQVAQFFARADSTPDGLLSRAEALRLPLVTMTFEDMDVNRDGVISRAEYEDSLR
jgi:hypothetical protein